MFSINNARIDLHSWMYVEGSREPGSHEAVSELNHHHFLTPAQEEKLSVLFTMYSGSTSTAEREELCPELDQLIKDLMDKRERVFEIKDENTDDVRGVLREGMTTEDRDDYIRDLMLLHVLKEKITMERTDKRYISCRVDALLSPHHSSELYGDLRAIKLLVEGGNRADNFGERILVPDLTHNKGSLQFG